MLRIVPLISTKDFSLNDAQVVIFIILLHLFNVARDTVLVWEFNYFERKKFLEETETYCLHVMYWRKIIFEMWYFNCKKLLWADEKKKKMVRIYQHQILTALQKCIMSFSYDIHTFTYSSIHHTVWCQHLLSSKF